MTVRHETIFRIPASFVLQRALLTAAELAYGVRHGWLSPNDVPAVIQARRDAGLPVPTVEDELARRAVDFPDNIEHLLNALDAGVDGTTQGGRIPTESRVWMYLALAWLYDHRASIPDAYKTLDGLYADWLYTPELSGLSYLLPPPAGQRPGIDGMEERWRTVLDRLATEFGQRAPA